MSQPFRSLAVALASFLAAAAALYAPAASQAAPAKNHHLGDRVPLRTGMHGHDVKVLQDYLTRAGVRTGIDGEFGRRTWRSVRRFEARAALAVNGVVEAGDVTTLRALVDSGGGTPAGTRSAKPSKPAPLAPGERATLGADGLAVAPAAAPEVVKQIIAAGNAIAKKPYKYGGGHGRWEDSGYDCSGSMSYALHGAGLLDRARDSSGFMRLGSSGPGRWLTIYAHGGHSYMLVAGLRFDTSGRANQGTRWQASMRSSAGYVVRHPDGL